MYMLVLVVITIQNITLSCRIQFHLVYFCIFFWWAVNIFPFVFCVAELEESELGRLYLPLHMFYMPDWAVDLLGSLSLASKLGFLWSGLLI